jgi:nicotinamidase-related amidase
MTHKLGEASLHEFYRNRGFSGRVGFGRHPAVLVIDLAEAWTNPRHTLGSDLSEVVNQTCIILQKARKVGIPIIFTTMFFDDELTDLPMVIRAKVPHVTELKRSSTLWHLHPALKRDPKTEPLLIKPRTSAFFATNLLSILNDKGVDTVIIVGCVTSGCIRATAESALNYCFHAIVPKEAVGDRSQSAHEANLFDIDARYADVVSVDEVIKYIDSLSGK